MPDPNNLDSYNFKSNPYLDGLDLNVMPQMPQEGGDEQAAMAQGGAQPAGGMPGQEGEEQENQLNPGQNPDKTRYLVAAIQQLSNYIKDSDQKDEIQTARGLIALLSQLVNRDQESMTSKL